MGYYYFSRPLDNDRALYIAPLADLDIKDSGETLDDASGYFVFHRSYIHGEAPVTILARLHSEEAALEMSRLLGLA